MKRRSFIRNVGLMAGLCGLYSWRVEPYWLDVEYINMPVKNLPDHLIGKKLMQISDIHVGNGFDKDFLINSFKKAQKLNPDFVVFTGDFVTWHNQEQLRQLDAVLNHFPKGKYATLGISGNHDFGKNWNQNTVADAVTDVAKDNGITMLRNRSLNTEGLVITGFEDLWSGRFNYDLMKDYNKTVANIVLCHNPDACDRDIWNDYNGWILAGHTHGGQIKMPFLDAPVVPVNNKRYTSGKIDLHDGRILYINCGLSTSHYLRFGVRPEITIFKLQKQ